MPVDLGSNFVNIYDVINSALSLREYLQALPPVLPEGSQPRLLYLSRSTVLAAAPLRIDRVDSSTPLFITIPSWVTLVIPPGVSLAIGSGVTVAITGSLQAGLDPVFTVDHGGRVLLLGPGLEAVYPEWWGAGTVSDTIFDDAVALQSAFNAAVGDRVAAGLPPVPLVLCGWYNVKSPLFLGTSESAPRTLGDPDPAPVPSPSSTFILRGNYGGSKRSDTPATLSCGIEFPDLPLLTIRGAAGFLVECVSFDAGLRGRSGDYHQFPLKSAELLAHLGDAQALCEARLDVVPRALRVAGGST